MAGDTTSDSARRAREERPVLLIEDSPEDREATVRAFRKAGLANPIHECEGGDQALDYLHRRGAFADPATSPRPSLILLDLNLPATDGREVLAEIKRDPVLRSIPVVVLSTSSAMRDVGSCYAAGANSYLQKPVVLETFVQAVRRLTEYWFDVVILPESGS